MLTPTSRRFFEDSLMAAAAVALPKTILGADPAPVSANGKITAAIWAMQAGKDVYVEKPVSQNVGEGRRIVQVARKLGRIAQTGTQNSSRGALAEAVKFMREGKPGEVKLAKSIIYRGRGSIGGPAECAMPPRCDYDLWAGPAPMTRLTRPKFHYDWHWFWDTGNGEIGNNNVHSLDICRWGLGVTGLGRSVLS